MPRFPLRLCRGLVVLTALAAGLSGLRWGTNGVGSEARVDGEAVVETRAFWQARKPAAAVAGEELARGDGKRAWLAEAVAVTPISVAGDFRWEVGTRLGFSLPDGSVVSGAVRLVQERRGGGQVAGGRLDDGGTFMLGRGGAAWTGVVMPKEGEHVFRVFRADDGGPALATVRRESVLCASMPRGPRPAGGAVGGGAGGGGAARQAVPVPVLESRPEAEAVIFLDFDGATVTDPAWNGGETIVAADSGMTVEAITTVWRRVAEDYRPFAINVTTDPARYAAARPMQRMRCIITTTSEWFGEVGGVAGLHSWAQADVPVPYYFDVLPYSADVPCWAFSEVNFFDPGFVALAVSHEVGHTLGLFHDGVKDATGVYSDEYYGGHGTGAASWGPIMGDPYGRALIQWSKGGYEGQMFGYSATGDILIGEGVSNNDEDDVAIVGGIINHTGFARERRGATLAEAGRLAVAEDGATVDHRGLIETGGAEAWLLVAAGAGPASLGLAADTAGDADAVNFDGALVLTDLAGVVIAQADASGTRFPVLSTTLGAAGTYVLRVKSAGEGSPTDDGYAAYGSIGRFRVQGTVTAGAGVAPQAGGAARVEGRVGVAMSYVIEASGAGLVHGATGLPAGLAVDEADGRVTGVPTEAGIFTVNVSATNAAGTASRAVVFAVAAPGLAEALDAPGLVFATGGDRGWRTVAEADAPAGGSAARSGEVLDGFQESWIETTLTGPGRLRWRWKVSSEEDYDFFHAEVDGVAVAAISGETDWAEHERVLGAGAQTVRWSFDKDPFLAVGQDAAWLDDVRWARGFELWAEEAGLAGAGAATGADEDGDGVVNLLEYAFARVPTAADGLGEAVVVDTTQAEGAEGRLEVVFTRPAGREDVRYTVEVSGDLITWEAGHAYGVGVANGGGLPTAEVMRETLAGGAERIRVRDTGGVSAARRFIRVRVTRS